jgi:hypothetical protein
MGKLGRRRNELHVEYVEDGGVLRDAEESLVAALQESDTAIETLGDAGTDGAAGDSRRRWTIGAAGLALALLGFMVARRRR